VKKSSKRRAAKRDLLFLGGEAARKCCLTHSVRAAILFTTFGIGASELGLGMRKTKGSSGSKTGKSTSSGGVRKQVDLEILRQKIANYVGSRGLEMVKTTTDEVVKVGNLAALKISL
jgi:hypothetical protein